MKSIRHKVLFATIFAALLPGAIILLVTNRITGDALEQSEYEKIASVGAELARQVGSSMGSAQRNLETLVTNPILASEETSLEARVLEMNRLVNIYKRFSDITIYYPDGHMLKSTSKGTHPEALEQTSWFKAARDEKTVVTSQPHRVVGLQGLHIKVYIPVQLAGSTRPHILRARLTFDSVWERIEGARLGKSGSVVLLDARGKILYSEDKNRILDRFDIAWPKDKWLSERRGVYTGATGADSIYCVSEIGAEESRAGESWLLVSFLPREEVEAAVVKSQNIQLGFGILTVLIVGAVGAWLARGLVAPLVLASDAAQQVARGNFSTRLIENQGSSEIRRLARSFNLMVDEVSEHRAKLSSLVERRTHKLHESETRLKETSAMLLASYEATQEAVLVVDPEGAVVAANQQLGKFFGVDSGEATGSPIGELKQPMIDSFEAPEAFRKEWDRLEADPYSYMESDWELRSPEERSLSIYSAPVSDREGVLCARLWMFRDTTEQHRLQAGLQQAQKMEAVGRLAGGVAHDFNNLLTGIIGNLSLAEMGGGTDEGESPEELMANAKGAGERAAELVKQLLGFSRRTHLEFSVGDCNQVLGYVDSLTRRTFDPGVKLVAEPDTNLWGAKVDLNKLEQVVMNMVVNAKDAMPDGGTIKMRTQNVTLDDADPAESISAKAGDYVLIEVSDDGEGMSQEILENVYEPFFTTKEQGKGTGLGLATSYGIVRQHGGWIDCHSVVGEGTTFKIYLPKAAETAGSSRPKVADSVVERAAERQGNETILLVDDEKVVRTVAQSVLKHHGYNILCAEDGQVALDMFESGEHEIDLVLLDLTMPNLSGAETFKGIRADHGDVPVIVCSGYTVNLDEFEASNGARPNGFVQKPYNIADLALKVRDCLDQACLTA